MAEKRLTQRAADKWDSARFLGFCVASGLYCSSAESQPAHLRLTPAVGRKDLSTNNLEVLLRKIKVNKKVRERMFLNEITTLYKDFPLGTIIDYESPDFLVDQNGHMLGIEIEDYVRGQTSEGSGKRHREMVWKSIIDKAQLEFETGCSIPVMVSFSWFPHRQPQQADTGLFAKIIASIVMNHIPPEPLTWVDVEHEELGNSPLEEFLHSMTVHRTTKYTSWSFDEGDFTEIRVDEIEWLISSKNDKVNQYLSACSIVWLIIIADGEYISSYGDLSLEIVQHPYQSKFERVLFYDRVRRIVFRLATQ